MSRKLSDCSCTHRELLKVGFKSKDLKSHHKLCSTNFKTIKEWHFQLARLAQGEDKP